MKWTSPWFVLVQLLVFTAALRAPARSHPHGVQAAFRQVLQAQREKTKGLAGSPAELRKALNSQLMQFPVPDALHSQATAAASGFGQVNATSVNQSTVTIHAMLRDAQWELDQAELQCRGTPSQLLQEAQEASAQAQNTGSLLGNERTVVQSTASRIPVSAQWFQQFAFTVKLASKDCEVQRRETKAHDIAMSQSRLRMQQLRTSLESQCSSGGSALQLPPHHHSHRHCIEEGHQEASLLQLPSWSEHLLPSTRERLRPTLLQIDALAGNASSRRLCRTVSQTCSELLGSMDEVLGELSDGRDMLQVWGAQRQKDCEEENQLAEAEMRRTSHRQQDLSKRLARATARMTLLARQEDIQDSHRQELDNKLDEVSRDCEKRVSDLRSQICGLNNLRDQLWLLVGRTELPDDCEVSDWEDGPCSKTCGMGERLSTRQVVAPAQGGGLPCPPLEMRRPCGEPGPCPANCVVSQWSGWSTCSADCDTGVRTRTRSALVQATRGGDACPNLVDVTECNSGACDQDCQLAPWSEWGLCSRACRGGHQDRSRRVVTQAVGNGRCPASNAQERLESRSCNTLPCEDGSTLTCSGTPLDVVVAVQAAGLASTTFDSMKTFCTELVNRFAPTAGGVHMGLLAFSNTVTVLSGLTSDSSALGGQVSSLATSSGANMVSKGLMAAGAMLRKDGRRNAVSTVILLVASRPTDGFRAGQVATSLRQGATRIIAVAAGPASDANQAWLPSSVNMPVVARLVAAPQQENLVLVPEIPSLASNASSLALEVAASACSALAAPASR